MREIRKSGSEGGAAQANESSLPLCPSLDGRMGVGPGKILDGNDDDALNLMNHRTIHRPEFSDVISNYFHSLDTIFTQSPQTVDKPR